MSFIYTKENSYISGMLQKIQSVIIDDEHSDIEALKSFLEIYCPEVENIGEASSIEEGKILIKKSNPELIFLDIELPDGLGFEILDKNHYLDFDVIFTTAHQEFALRAFEFSAIHYLLKPISFHELVEAIKRYKHNKNSLYQEMKFDIMREALNNEFKRIVLPTSDGFEVFKIDDIIRCEAEGCYTRFYIENIDSQVLVSTSLGVYDKLLSDLYFCRVHNKHLVNLKHIKKYVRSKGGHIIFDDGTNVAISERRKKAFLEKIKKYMRFN